MKHSLVFVATTPFAVNAFLRTHLLTLSQKYDVTLCVNTGAYPLAEDIPKSVRVVHVDIARKIAPWQDLRTLFQLFRCFVALRPDVVHSMMPKAGLLAMMAGRLARVPLRFHTFTGQVWANKAGIKRRLLKGIDRLIVACTTHVFADSASQCRLLENEGVVQTGGVTVLGEGSVAGVDLRRFRPDPAARQELRTAMGISHSVPLFLFVGRLARDKGIADLVEAFLRVNAQHPEWELWVVGPDEEGLLAQLQQRAQHLGQQVRWFGATTQPEHYMQAADVFVLASHREGFGSVILEAAACAVPAIAYRIDGVIDAIVDQETGVLVSAGDVAALAGTISAFGADVALREQLGRAALERAQRDFSSTAISSAWQNFYAQTLAQKEKI